MSEKDKLSLYGKSFQSKLIAGLFTDRQFLEQIQDILEDSYFESDSNKWLIKEIKKYFLEYKKPPTLEAIKIILSDPHRASVIGLDFKSELKATVMSSPDIRAGIALLIAALSANGTSVIQNVEQIDRGYENIVKRLNQLGAEIERI